MSNLVRATDAAQSAPSLRNEYVLNQPNLVLDLLPLGVCICDRGGVILRYNRSAAELWGRAPRPGELVERVWGTYGLRRPDDGAIGSAGCLVSGVVATGTPVRDQEIVIERPDGSCIVARVNADALRDGAGAVVGVVVCFRDVTERRRLQAALRDNERHSQTLLDALPVAVYTTDAAGRIKFYNQAAVDLWGRHPEPGRDAWCGSWRLYWPDGRPMSHDECPMAVALKEGRAIRGAEAIAERPDGTRVPFLAYPTPIWDETGAVTGAVNTLVDITERKHGEELSQYFALIVESSNDAIVGKDLNGIITSWNQGAERLFGYAAEEVIGRPIMIVIPTERHDEEQEILTRIRRGERIDHYETVRQRKDGSHVEISLSVSPVRNAEGRIIGASKIARDISERRRAQQQQNLLLREMSHRVKNLFALAGGVVTLSARFAQTPGEMADAVRKRLNALSQAHDLTLPDLNDGTERPEKHTTLHALVRTIVSPYSDPEQDGDERITVRGPDVPIGGSAMTSLALLLHEFATNAVKYGALSTSTGHVSVDWFVVEDELRFAWREREGPPLDEQAYSEGFGTLLGRATVKGQLGGSIRRDWEPEGLTIHLTVSLSRLTQ
ncbi:PAS domain S-box protein [Limobrevibacterium gyesilva]|uniref:histidine kinase n=1 Tax=Limobrevibacterium gyesilva TaxID=2991712 RepID=A0AA42CE63_9PROT|nr:PAS domain S-box protein [Limobrevibacterium gyesilva]MCW3474874.1 PAS domain S-box protein [Limobrevibacterium gyesilva]